MKFESRSIQQVWISPEVNERLWNWVDMAKGEVSMLGLVEECEDGPCITDVFLVKQTCTAASTDMDQTEVARLMFDLAAAGMESGLRAWIHSHGVMQAFWSTTDDATIEGFGFEPYAVSLVVNKNGDVKARVDLFEPIRCTIDDIPVRIKLPALDLEDDCEQVFRTNVREETLPVISNDNIIRIPPGPIWEDPMNPIDLPRDPWEEPWLQGEVGQYVRDDYFSGGRDGHGIPF